MSRRHSSCRDIERDLVAVAAGEAAPAAARAVEAHVDRCGQCRSELQEYRAVEALVARSRRTPAGAADPTFARAQLQERLAELRERLVAFGIFASPLGPILIARSGRGVALVEYLDAASVAASRLPRLAGLDAAEDPADVEALYHELLDYLEGRRTALDWALDFRWAQSDFQRRVLAATARLPYGAVASYAGIAREIGVPAATRAVAQALRWNPVPIAVPCHRVIGSAGDLTGYAGDRVSLKQRLLALEGVRSVAGRDTFRIDRHIMYVRYLAEEEYCVPTCGSLASTPMAKLTLFGSRERAEAAGLTPCTTCRPDLHPIPV
jgi:O-6-methylguanine DNA methyltransferase